MTGSAFQLEKDELFVGRDQANDITINDPEMSRRHARIYREGANYLIEDLGSTNGTSVSGIRLLGPYNLRAGDIIVFGETISLLFEALQTQTSATVPATQLRTPRAAPPPPPPQAYPPPQSPYPSRVGTGSDVKPKKKLPIGLIIVAAVLLLLCLCGAAVFAIDFTDSWCWLFSWLFDIFMPGVC
ncbi:MAG: FHA domain-containing protein [Anaerolineaceae bacterium]|nr:FHA domain-containing protein [Anaerolineaceae bacterium]